MNYKMTQSILIWDQGFVCVFVHTKKIKLNEMTVYTVKKEQTWWHSSCKHLHRGVGGGSWRRVHCPVLPIPHREEGLITGLATATLHCKVPFCTEEQMLSCFQTFGTHTETQRLCWHDLTTVTTIFCSLNPVCFGAKMQTDHISVLIFETQNSFSIKYWTWEWRLKLSL